MWVWAELLQISNLKWNYLLHCRWFFCVPLLSISGVLLVLPPRHPSSWKQMALLIWYTCGHLVMLHIQSVIDSYRFILVHRCLSWGNSFCVISEPRFAMSVSLHAGKKQKNRCNISFVGHFHLMCITKQQSLSTCLCQLLSFLPCPYLLCVTFWSGKIWGFSRRWLWSMVSSGMLRHVALVRTDVSEEPSASFIRVTRIGELGTTLAATNNRRMLRLSVANYS
jgi:hypothetical protein